jgi:hypothetical protein
MNKNLLNIANETTLNFREKVDKILDADGKFQDLVNKFQKTFEDISVSLPENKRYLLSDLQSVDSDINEIETKTYYTTGIADGINITKKLSEDTWDENKKEAV